MYILNSGEKMYRAAHPLLGQAWYPEDVHQVGLDPPGSCGPTRVFGPTRLGIPPS